RPGAHLRHLRTAASAVRVSRHRHRPGHLQAHRRAARGPHLGRVHRGTREHLPLHAAPEGAPMTNAEWDEEITPFPYSPHGGSAVRKDVFGRPRPPRTWTVLLIEDNPGDARLIEEYLKEVEGLSFRLERCERFVAGLDRLARGGIDVVLLDLSLPDSRGLDTFVRLHAAAPGTPVVVLTGFNDELLAVKAVQEGAEDYLVKGYVNSNLLARSLRYAIERTRRRQAGRRPRQTEAKLHGGPRVQRRPFPGPPAPPPGPRPA